MLQRVVGVEMIEACGVDDTEKEVAQLFGGVFLVLLLQLCLQFAHLLFHFVPHVLFLLPVKAHVACFVLNAVGLDERGQGRGHTAEHAGVAVALTLLDLFPRLFHAGCRLGLVGILAAVGLAVFVDHLSLGSYRSYLPL